MKKQFSFGLLAVFVLFLSACGNNGGGSSSPSSGAGSESEMTSEKAESGNQSETGTPTENMTTLQLLKNEKAGKYLADGQGMTLYYYTKDEPGESYCKGGCLKNWPAFYGDVKNLKVPEGFDKNDFGTITREDTGKKQITYKGYPLYYYVKDEEKGDVKGQGVGGVWYIVNASTMFGENEDDQSSGQKDDDDGYGGY